MKKSLKIPDSLSPAPLIRHDRISWNQKPGGAPRFVEAGADERFQSVETKDRRMIATDLGSM
jgi:hypothetical protein